MGLFERIFNEPVHTLALRPAIRKTPTASVSDAIAEMRRKRLGCVIVVDESDRPIGAFTERSITRALATGSLDPDDAIETYLDPSWGAVQREDPVRRVLEAMNARGTRFIAVTDENGKVSALTGQKAVVECLAEYFPEPVQIQTRRIGSAATDTTKEGA